MEIIKQEPDEVPKKYNNAKFCGIRLLHGATINKYSPMNIEFVFAQLEGKPKIELKPTRTNENAIAWIMQKSENLEQYRIILIENWQVDIHAREIARMLTGNILDAYSIARERIKNNESYAKRIKFLKFTTADGTIRFGLRLFQQPPKPLQPENTPVSIPINDLKIIDYIKESEQIRDDEETITLRYSSNTIRLLIHGGIYRWRSSSTPSAGEKKKKGLYYSKYFDDDSFWKITTKEPERGIGRFYPKNTSRAVSIIAKYITFDIENKSDMGAFQKYVDYIYKDSGLRLNFYLGETAETVVGLEDIYRPETEKEETKEGIYEYYLLAPYKIVEEKIRNFVKFNKFIQDSAYPNGKIILKAKANVRESMAYSLAPINHTASDMVKDAMTLISEEDKMATLNVAGDMVKDNQPIQKIGQFIYDKIKNKVLSMQNVFGKLNSFGAIGQVFKNYFEKTEEPVPVPEPEKQKPEKKQKPLLDYETAEKYVILLHHK